MFGIKERVRSIWKLEVCMLDDEPLCNVNVSYGMGMWAGDYDLGRRWRLAGMVVSRKRFSSLYCVDVGVLPKSVEGS